MDWVLPTDEILAAQTAASEERNVAPPKAAAGGVEGGVTSRLRKFATHFKLAF
jgi:hypothetical protein